MVTGMYLKLTKWCHSKPFVWALFDYFVWLFLLVISQKCHLLNKTEPRKDCRHRYTLTPITSKPLKFFWELFSWKSFFYLGSWLLIPSSFPL